MKFYNPKIQNVLRFLNEHRLQCVKSFIYKNKNTWKMNTLKWILIKILMNTYKNERNKVK